MLGWRWESPERGQRQPLFGCRRQRDKTLNKVSISRSAKHIRVICNSNSKHLFKYLFGLPPARKQAKRLQ